MATNKAPDRLTVPQVLPLVEAIYKRHAGGCCLHIITDDDNVKQSHADWVLEFARERGHKDCIAAADMLRRMTRTQRHEVCKRNVW